MGAVATITEAFCYDIISYSDKTSCEWCKRITKDTTYPEDGGVEVNEILDYCNDIAVLCHLIDTVQLMFVRLASSQNVRAKHSR